ncbi:MAG: cation:proton antiporter [Candidatus Hydrogenedentes bacterium]|nr:cation:proton antiporter [Candidatus Hydrogenedentota bacterium]
MTHPEFLTDIVIILATTLLVARLFLVLHAPSIIGFILAGIAIGPHAANLIGQEDVGELAELGLILLLFIIGLELSPKPLLRMGKNLLMASTFQIVSTAVVAATAVLLFTRMSTAPILILGVAVALSSTAIVLKQLSDLGATNTLRGMIITGILLIQDVLVIVIMLFLPFFAVDPGGDWKDSVLRAFLGLAGIGALTAIGRALLPTFLKYVVRPGGKEFVTLFAVLMAFGGAWVAGEARFSLPLGACIAGLLLAGTDLRHQLAASILPFRDVFNALFFVSLGMLFDPAVAQAHALPIMVAILATLLIKVLLCAMGVAAARWPLLISFQVGLGLCTVSEFGYVLVSESDKLGLVPSGLLEVFIVYALGTMTAGAMLIPLSEPIAALFTRFIRPGAQQLPVDSADQESKKCDVVIVGYGINGKNLVRVLQSTKIPHVVIEMNPSLAHDAQQEEAEVICGDGCRLSVLQLAGLANARALVVAINDPQATRRVVSQARLLRPDLYILARTHFDSDIDELYALGAERVISEDFETSIEIAAQILKRMDVPDNIVTGQIAALRAGHYGILRAAPTADEMLDELAKFLQTTATRTHYLEKGSSACGKTIADLDLRAQSGVTIIAVVRNGKPTANPPTDFELAAGDVLVLVGSHKQLDDAESLLAPPHS